MSMCITYIGSRLPKIPGHALPDHTGSKSNHACRELLPHIHQHATGCANQALIVVATIFMTVGLVSSESHGELIEDGQAAA